MTKGGRRVRKITNLGGVIEFSKPVLYNSTNIWVLHYPNTGWNMLFHMFSVKKLKKETRNKIEAKFSKKHVFLSFHPNAGFLFPENPWPAFGCKLKKNCFAEFCFNFASIFWFLFFEKAYFDQLWSVQHLNAGQNIQQTCPKNGRVYFKHNLNQTLNS